MKSLITGRKASGSKLVAIALFACTCLGGLAYGQTPTPPVTSLPSPLNSLSPSQQVINCSAGADQTAEAGVGVVNFHGTITNGYTSDPPPSFFWVNMGTNTIDELGQDNSETAPRQSCQFVLIVWDTASGNW